MHELQNVLAGCYTQQSFPQILVKKTLEYACVTLTTALQVEESMLHCAMVTEMIEIVTKSRKEFNFRQSLQQQPKLRCTAQKWHATWGNKSVT